MLERRTRLLTFIAASAVLIPTMSLAQQSVDRGQAISPDAYIRVHNLAGNVRVIGWQYDSLGVTGSVEPGGTFFMGGSLESAKVLVEPEEMEEEAVPGHIEVRVPQRSTVWIKTESADVDVSEFAGSVDVYSVTGRVEIVGELRQVYAESMGGDVELSASAPSVRAKTAGGSITFRGESEDLDLSSVAGDISVIAPPIRRGRFESVTGNIRFEGAVMKSGSLEFSTHDGTVELRMPSDLSADFQLSTIAGKIRSRFNGERMERYRGLRGRSLNFESGGGGATVAVRTFSGTIVLRSVELTRSKP